MLQVARNLIRAAVPERVGSGASEVVHMYWKPIEKTADTVVKIHLEGMSESSVPELASLARSWESPARLTIGTAGFSGGEYDPSERAWIIERTGAKIPLAITIAASPESPVENLAMIVKAWGEGDAGLEADGRRLGRGTDLRIGHRQRLEATDLVVFATIHATSPIRLVLTP